MLMSRGSAGGHGRRNAIRSLRWARGLPRNALPHPRLFTVVITKGRHPMKIVLFEPEIPPNTGNIARLCASCGHPSQPHRAAGLQAGGPLPQARRAGLLAACAHGCLAGLGQLAGRRHGGERRHPPRCVLTSARGGSPCSISPSRRTTAWSSGPRRAACRRRSWKRSPYRVRIPMRKDSVRSINLSTAAGIVLFTAMSSCGLMEGPEWR